MKGTLAAIALLLIAAIISSFISVQATPTLKLSFYKDNGYSMGNDINGLWTINTEVYSNTTHVEFYIDEILQLNDTTSPYSWQFDTNNYTEGIHTIKVAACDTSGEQAIAERQPNFVGFPLTFVVGIIVLIVVVLILSFSFAIYRARKKEAKERLDKY